MKHKLLLPPAALAAAMLLSCEDIIEKDLDKSALTVLAPADGYATVSPAVLFWWEEVKGAIDYKVQIVSPSFTNVQKLVADTNVSGDKLSLTLLPGTYQWRIRAENGSSQTDYVTRTLTIDSTENISGFIVSLRSPAAGYLSPVSSVTFRWDTVYAAAEYRLQIAQPDFGAGGNIFYDVTTQADSLVYSFIANGSFTWRLRAQNAASNTLYSERSLIIDTVSPSPPVLLAPLHAASPDSFPVTLSWTHDADVTGDSLFVFHPDSLKLLAGFPVYETATSYSFTNTSADSVYFWKLKSVDGAGHESGFSEMRKFYTK